MHTSSFFHGTLPRSSPRQEPGVCPRTGKALEESSRAPRHLRILLVIAGLAALLWFLVRVIPKPSRAAYPCQRVAFPLASSFVLGAAGFFGSLFALRRARRYLREARRAAAVLCAIAGGTLAVVWSLSLPQEPATAAWTPAEPPNSPLGEGKGIHPGRVTWIHDPSSTSWNGPSGNWWGPESTEQAVVDAMLSRSLQALTGETTDAAAWSALFRHFHQVHGGGGRGYQVGERIAVKINQNVASDYGATNAPIASPQMVRAILRQLVHTVGASGANISVYDAARCISNPIFDYCHAEFPEVQFVDTRGQLGRVRAVKDDGVPVYYSGPGAGASGTSRLPTCVVGSTYLINMALLRGHSIAGVTLCAKNHFGSVWRPDGGFSPSNLHTPIDRNLPMGSYNCLVDLMGHEHLGGKTLLYLIDALYAAAHQSAGSPVRWRMAPFEDDWTSSLFLSQDGVAIDSVALDFCRSEPALSAVVTGRGVDNYLHEAALAHAPPSSTVYDPEGDGTTLGSLGVHEHWNDATAKQYSRNLGTGEGIDLVKVPPAPVFRRGDSNADGETDIADAVSMLLYLFVGGGSPGCLASLDADDSGEVDITDPLYLLRYLFQAGSPLPSPAGSCGLDPTSDGLGCEAYTVCG